MGSAETLIGLVAAFCTTASYLPQVHKVWKTRSTHDLSMGMMLLLFASLSLWVTYGVIRRDPVIVIANTISLAMLAGLVVFKARELLGRPNGTPAASQGSVGEEFGRGARASFAGRIAKSR